MAGLSALSGVGGVTKPGCPLPVSSAPAQPAGASSRPPPSFPPSLRLLWVAGGGVRAARVLIDGQGGLARRDLSEKAQLGASAGCRPLMPPRGAAAGRDPGPCGGR